MNRKISLDTIKLLNEKNITILVECGCNDNIPTVIDVVMYLYKKHNLWLCVNCESHLEAGSLVQSVPYWAFFINGYRNNKYYVKDYPDPCDAIEEGIKFVISEVI